MGGVSLLLLVALVLQIPTLRMDAVRSHGLLQSEVARQVAVPIVARTQTQPKRQGELPTAALLSRRNNAAIPAGATETPPSWSRFSAARRPPVRFTSLPPPAAHA